jgi:hypothetical protein
MFTPNMSALYCRERACRLSAIDGTGVMAARRTGGAMCVDSFVDLSVVSCMGFGPKTIPCACSVLPYDLWTVGGIKGLISILRHSTTFTKVDVRESFFYKICSD